MPEDVALRDDVATEPLVGGWYAWLHALSPMTSALLSESVHLPILQSYVSAPSVHASAVADPAFRGGPFVDVEGDRSAEISELILETERSTAAGSRAGRDLNALEALLGAEATGTSMKGFYEQIPETLRGLVELSYDRDHRPSVQTLEALLYRSDLHRRGDQSVDLFISEDDRRPFAMSTPRLPDPARCRVHLPFRDPKLDDLFSTRITPRPLEDLREEFCEALSPSDELFPSLFTPYSGAPTPEESVDGVRLRYFGHACVLMETRGCAILVDPLIPPRPSFDGRFGWRELPRRIDWCLISHGHPDHFAFEALLPLRHRIDTVVVPKNVPGSVEDPSLKLALRELGFPSIVEVDEFEELPIAEGRIHSAPFLGEHADLRIRSKCCYVVETHGRRILFAADAAPENPELIDRVTAETGSVDVIFLGMECDGAPLTWLYGHLFNRPVARDMNTSRRLSGSDARLASEWVRRSGASQAYIYAMGFEPWVQHIMATNFTPESKQMLEIQHFLETCRTRGVGAEALSTSRTMILARPRAA
jgi:L-ascorbate metabolism protein UlaG (beta-lactamase superfamily)